MQRPVSGKQGLESQSRAWGAWGPFPAALSAGAPRPHVLSAVRSGPAHAGRALPGGTCPGLGPWAWQRPGGGAGASASRRHGRASRLTAPTRPPPLTCVLLRGLLPESAL